MTAAAILLCAGSSNRMGFCKLTAPLPGGGCALLLSARALVSGGAQAMVLVVSQDTRAAAQEAAQMLAIPTVLVQGGATRQESVQNGLAAAQAFAPELIAIHDAARCMAEPSLIRACFRAAKETGSGIAALPARDSVHLLEDVGMPRALPREQLRCTQTPQTFRYAAIVEAYAQAARAGLDATDDCSIYAAAGAIPTFVPSSARNFKLTTPEDFTMLCALLYAPAAIGTGEDVHRLVPGRALILGGVTMLHETGLLGHSDADVLTHAIIDAVLGGAGLPDIGRQFPDSDPAYAGADSLMLLRTAMERVRDAGFALINVDAIIIAERPKLAPHIPAMRENLARAMGAVPGQVNVKATTTEGIGPEGEGLCMRATAAALLRRA